MKDGQILYTTDEQTLYIDTSYYDDGHKQRRDQINANYANKLKGYEVSTVVEELDTEIPTSKAVADAVAQKTLVQIVIWEDDD